MSTPRFYSWDDDGSPGRALTGNLQNKLKQILVPCLVTGYGGKPGAGWTVGHEHANGFSLINVDGNVVNFVSDLPAQAPYPAMISLVIHIYTAESITNTSNAIIDGANLCSGNYRKGFPEPAGYQRHSLTSAGRALSEELGSMQWTVLSDDKTFTISVSSARSSATSSDTGAYSFSIHCGKAVLDTDITGNFLALGGDIANYNTAYSVMNALCKGFSSPVDLLTGLAQTVNVGASPYDETPGLNPSASAPTSLARLNFQQPRLKYGGNFIGRLRGVVYDDVLRSYYGWVEHLKVLGFNGTDFTDRGKLVLIDGHNYAFARSYSGNFFLTDNPAFW